MAITAQTIINKAKTTLLDSSNVRWADSDHLAALNDGQREIASLRPDLFATTAAVQLTSGTKQTIPSGGSALLYVFRNMGTNGSTPGRAVRQVARDVMDAVTPTWHSTTSSATTTSYIFDSRSPKEYYVFPPSTGTNYLEIRYVTPPTDVAALANNISVDDIFSNALMDYVLFRAYSKDQDLDGNGDRAMQHRQLFVAQVTGKTMADSSVGGLKVNPSSAG